MIQNSNDETPIVSSAVPLASIAKRDRDRAGWNAKPSKRAQRFGYTGTANKKARNK